MVIRGATVMRGFLNRPADTAKTIVGGWLHTGDVGMCADRLAKYKRPELIEVLDELPQTRREARRPALRALATA